MLTIRSLLAGALLASATALAVAASPSTTSESAPAPAKRVPPSAELAPSTSSPWAGLDPHLICLPGEAPEPGTLAAFA